MPFVTEALWAALPHRATDPELLIVARWPGAGERDLAVEAEVGALIELVTEIRNARAQAKLPAADWLETLVYVPLAARPDLRGAPPGDRAAGPRTTAPARADARGARGGHARRRPDGHPGRREIEAAVRPARARRAAADLERERLERELAEAEGWLAAARERLANASFVARAPAAVVDGARAREAELAEQVARLRERTRR